jgi:tetratricopeptide (TPR) repeat protein
LGIIKRTLKDYIASLKYYSKVINSAKTDNERGIAYNNIGVVYKYLKKNDSALIMYKKAYQINLKTNNKKEMVRSLDNLGYIQSKLNDKQGLNNMLKALKIRLEINDYNIYTSYMHLGKYYENKNELKKSLEYAKKRYQLAVDFNSKEKKLDALRNLVDLEQYSFNEEYNLLRDKIDSEKL